MPTDEPAGTAAYSARVPGAHRAGGVPALHGRAGPDGDAYETWLTRMLTAAVLGR